MSMHEWGDCVSDLLDMCGSSMVYVLCIWCVRCVYGNVCVSGCMCMICVNFEFVTCSQSVNICVTE